MNDCCANCRFITLKTTTDLNEFERQINYCTASNRYIPQNAMLEFSCNLWEQKATEGD